MPYVESDIGEFEDDELIEELIDRGVKFHLEDEDEDEKQSDLIIDDIHRLYMDYRLIGGAFFENQLKLFFGKYAD